MKKEFYFKIEELPVVAGFTIENATRDLADFTAFSPMFTPEYLKAVGTKRDSVNALIHSSTLSKQLKVITGELAVLTTNFRTPLNRIENYFRLAKDQIDILPQDIGIKQVRKMIGSGNAEGLMQELRRLIATLERNKEALKKTGFTDAMLEEVKTTVAGIDRLNTQQSILMSERNINTQENVAVFNDLWRDVKSLIETGKAIYNRVNPAKAKDYSIAELRRRVNAERPKKKEPQKPQDTPMAE